MIPERGAGTINRSAPFSEVLVERGLVRFGVGVEQHATWEQLHVTQSGLVRCRGRMPR